MCHYGSEKTIRGRIFVWPAIFQGINGTMDKHSNPERRIRVCLAMLNNLNFLLTLQSKTSICAEKAENAISRILTKDAVIVV